jgi:predicted Fe-Mo cluster-binding NifX family protein
MKAVVAITSQNKKTVTKHAGECRNYLIYTIEKDIIAGKKVLELQDNEILKYTFHHDKSENPKNVLFDMDILLTGSIGQGGINKLANQNVTAYIIKEKDPDVAIEKLIKGTLEAFAPVSHSKGGCGNHHH